MNRITPLALLFDAFSSREPVSTSLENALVSRGPDQRQCRQQIEMGAVAQRQPQIARGKPRVFTHDRFGTATLAVLDGVDHDAVMVLPDQQDLMRLRHL